MNLKDLMPDPTFKAKVPIPLPGREPVEVEFTFQHRTRTQLTQLLDEAKTSEADDVDYLLRFTAGWDLQDEFTRENLAVLLQHYHAAGGEIARVYIEELTQAGR